MNRQIEQEAARMARCGATDDEIGLLLNLSPGEMEELRRRLEIERAARRVAIRKKQTELALAGSERMILLLGEIELNQRMEGTAMGEPMGVPEEMG